MTDAQLSILATLADAGFTISDASESGLTLATRITTGREPYPVDWRTAAEIARVCEMRQPDLSVPEAAAALGISHQAVRQAIKTGRLEATLTNNRHRVTRAALKAYRVDARRKRNGEKR